MSGLEEPLTQPNPSAAHPPVAFPQNGSSSWIFQELNRGHPGTPLHAEDSGTQDSPGPGWRSQDSCILVPAGQDLNHSPSAETPAPNTAMCPLTACCSVWEGHVPSSSSQLGDGQKAETLRNTLPRFPVREVATSAPSGLPTGRGSATLPGLQPSRETQPDPAGRDLKPTGQRAPALQTRTGGRERTPGSVHCRTGLQVRYSTVSL